MNTDIPQLADRLIALHQAYALTFRKIVTAERYNALIATKLLKDYTYETVAIREPLLEHVGHLPVIASYLHRHIEHRDAVDLGRVLTMLSIHDIGETKVGDVLAYAKVDAHEDAERQAARELLPDYLYAYFEEWEAQATLDAKFAAAVDSLAPLLHEIEIPAVTRERFKYYRYNVDNIVAKKQAHFAWDSVLLAVFEHVIGRLRRIEAGQE